MPSFLSAEVLERLTLECQMITVLIVRYVKFAPKLLRLLLLSLFALCLRPQWDLCVLQKFLCDTLFLRGFSQILAFNARQKL